MTWICPVCGKKYSTSEGRTQHVKSEHPEEAAGLDVGGRSGAFGRKDILQEWRE